MNVLVIGGTGTLGSEVVARLLELGVGVRFMTRYADKIVDLPEGVEGCVGDLDKPSSLTKPFKGIQEVFLLTPLSENETDQGLAAVEAAKQAGTQKIVYLSVPMRPGSEDIPHYRRKVPVEEAMKSSGLAYTIIRPNNIFQNDFWCKAAIMAYHVYPQPIGMKGLNRVDARDVADAAVNALTKAGFEGDDYVLHGPDTLNGEDSAQVFARYLGQEVHYSGGDLDSWAKQAQHMMPRRMVNDLKEMYRFFQDHGLVPEGDELRRQVAIVGHEPRRYADFVAEIVPQWQAEARNR